ncbi:MAG TPA: amidohydrolase family protein [Candidatus Binataceae bacterium]|jgi:predicted TIM-barrel fold metal-dependent hydrolase|nr:amidohydrolase family protein [Candidatus Binataceae bacterium]
MPAQRVISADSHMTEPGDLWVQRLDRKYRDNAPRVVKNERESGPAYLFVGPGIHPLAVAAAFAAGKGGEELREHMKHGYEAARPSGWDPVERLKDQDLDGVVSEVLYSTLGIVIFNMKDIELQLACLRAYNDWLAEFCAHSPKRLVGVGLYSLAALPDVSEIERCAKKGLKGVLILASDSNDLPYSDERFDPLWRTCSELSMPISLHKPLVSGMPLTPAMPTAADLQIHVIHVVEQCITRLVYGGVFERFPKLRVVSAENDVGWIPNWVNRLDHVHSKVANARRLPLKPSDYVRRNVWATFQDDPLGPATWQFFGERNYMWASDFPHADSTFPNSLKVIDGNFAGVPAEITRRIVFDNANELYQMGLN